MEIIIPCAGLSTRFPNVRPKYLLNGFDNKLMIEKSVEPIIGKYNITLAILQEHELIYNISYILKNVFGSLVNVVVLPERTRGPADTVYQTIKILNIDDSVPILIKDCDSFFDFDIITGNGVYFVDLTKNIKLNNIASKSFVLMNDNNIIMDIIEKKIISNFCCAGAYQFESVSMYKKYFEMIAGDNEIFVSNVIKYSINDNRIFLGSMVDNFVDVGTIEDWLMYNNRPTYFCDIDGVLVKTELLGYDLYEPLFSNINVLLKEQNRGCKIVFCTARHKKYETITKEMLTHFGFIDYELVMGLHHSKRILVNDFCATNPHPSSVSINLNRNADDLNLLI